MTQDFADFLAALNKEGVAYVVIGGIAVLAYLPYRTTRDLDVLIEPTLDNAERAAGRWRAATYFAGLDDLIAMKEAGGRADKDLPTWCGYAAIREAT